MRFSSSCKTGWARGYQEDDAASPYWPSPVAVPRPRDWPQGPGPHVQHVGLQWPPDDDQRAALDLSDQVRQGNRLATFFSGRIEGAPTGPTDYYCRLTSPLPDELSEEDRELY